MQMKFEDVDLYLQELSPPGDSIMKSMEAYAAERGFPIVGPLVGRFLYQLAKISDACEVLELGSGFGYSAYWFARAIGKKGSITLTDLYEENRELALKYFQEAQLKSRYDFLVGDSLEIARKLHGAYDIIFNDIDKEDYPATIDIAARLTRPGGIFIADNIMWDGLVLDSRVRDKETVGIRRFTARLYADNRFFTTVIPLRDGLTLAVRR
jgi:caffeoyl-CoA O-methyltransferase